MTGSAKKSKSPVRVILEQLLPVTTIKIASKPKDPQDLGPACQSPEESSSKAVKTSKRPSSSVSRVKNSADLKKRKCPLTSRITSPEVKERKLIRTLSMMFMKLDNKTDKPASRKNHSRNRPKSCLSVPKSPVRPDSPLVVKALSPELPDFSSHHRNQVAKKDLKRASKMCQKNPFCKLSCRMNVPIKKKSKRKLRREKSSVEIKGTSSPPDLISPAQKKLVVLNRKHDNRCTFCLHDGYKPLVVGSKVKHSKRRRNKSRYRKFKKKSAKRNKKRSKTTIIDGKRVIFSKNPYLIMKEANKIIKKLKQNQQCASESP